MNDKMKAEFDAAFVKKFGFGRMMASADGHAYTILAAAEWAWEAAAAPTPPQPIYDEAKAVKDFEAWVPSFWNKEKYQDDEGDWLYSDDLVQGALVGWLACARSRAKAGEDE